MLIRNQLFIVNLSGKFFQRPQWIQNLQWIQNCNMTNTDIDRGYQGWMITWFRINVTDLYFRIYSVCPQCLHPCESQTSKRSLLLLEMVAHNLVWLSKADTTLKLISPDRWMREDLSSHRLCGKQIPWSQNTSIYIGKNIN